MNARNGQERETVEGDAIAWLLRLDAPDATEADWLAAGAWLEAAPEHREAFDRVQRIALEVTDAGPELLKALDAPAVAAAPRRQPWDRRAGGRRPQPVRRIWRGAAGLVAAAAALVVFVVVRPPSAPTAAEVFQTAKGEDRVVQLADGSQVHLNSASRISVRLERTGRYVELTEGEAAFNVAKDPGRPFLIAAGERDIRVVGTEFGVLRHRGRLRVTVRHGVVAVQAPAKAAALEPVVLKAGDELDHQPGARLWTVRRVDPDAAFAWKNGDLVYRDQRLDEVVADLNRYFTTPVHVVGPAASLRFSGVLRIDSEADVVRRLEGFLPVTAEPAPNGVTLRMRAAAG